MRKNILLWLLVLCLSLTGCAGDTVIYQVEGEGEGTPQPTPPPAVEPTAEAVKTGLALVTDVSGSRSAEEAVYDVTVVALTVDDGGVIRACRIDGVGAELPFDTTGTVTGSTGAVPSRRQQEEADDEAADEWYDTAEELAEEAVGKTVEQLRRAADDKARRGMLLDAVETAARRARHLGATVRDELRLALQADLSGSTSATESEAGRARLSCNAAAVTFSGDTVTSCRFDSVQADVSFDAMGTIVSDVTAPVKTKTELGEDYGMKRYGGAKYEWYEQADHFADYVTGKTAAQVAAIAVSEGKPTGADLVTSVTISVTPFQQLIAQAAERRGDRR